MRKEDLPRVVLADPAISDLAAFICRLLTWSAQQRPSSTRSHLSSSLQPPIIRGSLPFGWDMLRKQVSKVDHTADWQASRWLCGRNFMARCFTQPASRRGQPARPLFSVKLLTRLTGPDSRPASINYSINTHGPESHGGVHLIMLQSRERWETRRTRAMRTSCGEQDSPGEADRDRE